MPDTRNYRTVKKEEVRRLADNGEPITYYRIWAISNGGTRFHVEVPEHELKSVDKLLTDKAKTLDAI